MRIREWCAGAALVAATAWTAHAQTVRGTVVGRGEAPMPGVLLVLLDSSGVVGRSFSDERGAFRVTASRAGAFRLQATRIGFRPVVSDVMTLAVGDTRDQRIMMDGISIALDTVRVVSGRRSCRL